MTDRIRVSVGSQPWRPDPESHVVKVIQRATIPLVGIVSQDEVKYVFWCAIGHAQEANLWLYSHVTDEEADRLESVSSQAGLVEALQEVTAGKAEVVALASNDEVQGILFTTHLDPPAGFGSDTRPIVEALRRSLVAANHVADAVSTADDRDLAGV